MAWKNADNIMLNDFLQKVIKLNKEHKLPFIITLEVINQKYSSSDKTAKAVDKYDVEGSLSNTFFFSVNNVSNILH